MSKINIREINYKEDTEKIIELLNISFDSNHNRKDFLWKHFDNPFGKSYGLLAIDGDKIIGLRMFMRWEFINDSRRVFKAIRPVDTCTDPAYRGLGIFKRLTLEGLKRISSEYELVFNTPNKNSKPGYLKMGWNDLNQDISYSFGILNLFGSKMKFELINSTEINHLQNYNTIQTKTTLDYLKWRYSNLDYLIAHFMDGATIVFKIKNNRGFKTVILFEIFCDDMFLAGKYLRSICYKFAALGVYFLNSVAFKDVKFIYKIRRNNQSVVYKDDKMGIVDSINFTLGDLEGKL